MVKRFSPGEKDFWSLLYRRRHLDPFIQGWRLGPKPRPQAELWEILFPSLDSMVGRRPGTQTLGPINGSHRPLRCTNVGQRQEREHLAMNDGCLETDKDERVLVTKDGKDPTVLCPAGLSEVC